MTAPSRNEIRIVYARVRTDRLRRGKIVPLLPVVLAAVTRSQAREEQAKLLLACAANYTEDELWHIFVHTYRWQENDAALVMRAWQVDMAAGFTLLFV
ncbi:hypothetical protein EXIGLDRAFT_768298 [Exidia glandulosa HHB12029]|uniref:Uncharacterized protein n=1 Tax=Exidia glandulosa HHB12029 TaxID=1314781 RepID=A0A166ALN1_EXIGL|nr:hypothetical protein EXIGLDRAFT_768298 [Exidia glandulosa HHB12029]